MDALLFEGREFLNHDIQLYKSKHWGRVCVSQCNIILNFPFPTGLILKNWVSCFSHQGLALWGESVKNWPLHIFSAILYS